MVCKHPQLDVTKSNGQDACDAEWDLNFGVNKSAAKIQTWACSYDVYGWSLIGGKEKPLMIADLKHKVHD